MSLVTVPQVNPNDEVTALSVNQGANAIAAIVNGQIDDANINTISGTKISAGTLPVSASAVDANPETRMAESLNNFVASGCVWSTVSALNGSMTAGVVYINGKRIVALLVSSRTFTASRDTYVSINNAGTVAYTDVANNATSPALPADSTWLAIVVTGVSAITSVRRDGISSLSSPVYPRPQSTINVYNPVKFSVTRTAALNSAAADTVIAFDTTTFDTGRNVDITTNRGRFTAPVSGFYHFDAAAGNTAATSTSMRTSIAVNGTIRKVGVQSSPTTANNVHNVGCFLQLNAGDYAEALFLGGGGSAMQTGTQCYFEGFLVSAS